MGSAFAELVRASVSADFITKEISALKIDDVFFHSDLQ
jgi:hypothetical protein